MPHIARSGSSVLAKLVSGGGENFGIPPTWTSALYSSGWPIAPVTQPQDDPLPRTIDYPVSVNSSITPRVAYGLMAFNALLTAYENVAELKAIVNLITRELVALVPHLVDGDGNPVKDHPYEWMTKSPDGKTPFGVWLTRLVKSTKVYDAPAVYLHRSQGSIDALHYIDGSTLFVILDEFGNVPDAEPVRDYVNRVARQGGGKANSVPQLPGATVGTSTIQDFAALYDTRARDGLSVPDKIPAYTQIIKGTPFSWWSADDIWYMPQSRRMNAPYGDSFIEDAWPWIMTIVNITAFELAHYRTGNMPEGFVTMPTAAANGVDELMVLEMAYNQRMAGNPTTERNRLRFFPDGAKYFATKKPDFPKELYSQAWHNILNVAGVLPSDFGDMPGAGLGGGGFKKQATSDTSRQSINPNREFFASIFNAVLEKDGVDDVKFALDYALEEIDPDKKRQSVFDGMAHGTLSLNDALGELNQTPIGSPTDKDNIANKHLIVAGASIFVVEDMQTQNGMALPTLGAGVMNQTGGVPVNPETAIEQAGAEHTPQDRQTVQKLIRMIQETGTLDGKFISVPSAPPMQDPDSFIVGTASQPDPLSELHAWNNLVRRWGALAKFTVHQLNDGVEAFIRAELSELPPDASRALRKAVFDDAAYVMGARSSLRKDYEDTEGDFVTDITDIIQNGQDGTYSAAKLGGQMRSIVRRFGLVAMRDGFNVVDKNPESFDAETLKAFREWQAQQSAFISNFVQEVTKQGITPDEVTLRAEMWKNRTLESARELGMSLGAPDAMVKWVEDGTLDKCPDCLALDGQVHKLSDWQARNLTPTSGATQCKSYNCLCSLEPTDEPENGNYLDGSGDDDPPDGSADKLAKEYDPSQPRDEHGMWTMVEGWQHRSRRGVENSTSAHDASSAHVQTLDGKFEPDTGTPGDTPDSLNHFMNTSNGPLAYAIGDGTTRMVDVDYSGDEDKYTVNRANVKAEAAAFVKESQNIQYGKDYLLSLAKDHAAENGVELSDSELESAYNQQYATRAEAIQKLAKIGNVPLTDAQERRLQMAADGKYLDMVYAKNYSEGGTLVPLSVRHPTFHGAGTMVNTPAAREEARANFRDWVLGQAG